MSGAPTAEPQEGVAARRVALDIVQQVHAEDAWASPVADRLLSASSLDARDRAFAANLAFSTLRWEGTLDWVLGQTVSRPLDQVEPALLDLLRIATWELQHGGQPAHAVVHSQVELARTVVGQRATGFVNGVLRSLAKGLDRLPWPPEDTARGLALREGYPVWVAHAATERFGADRAPAVLQAGNVPAPLVLRAVAPRDDVLAALAVDGVRARPGTLADDAVVLQERANPADLAVVADRMAVVQDQASQVVGQVAADGLPAGATAIDLCAAPGGKSTHLAQRGLSVTAVDVHPGRLRRAAALADDLGLDLRTVAGDGREVDLPEGAADLVLVDAPCTGLGVVRRRPELRWRRGPGDARQLQAVQVGLLRRALELVRPGGRVVYSVCTWTVHETDPVVEQVLTGDDGRTASVGTVTVEGGTPTTSGIQLAPDVDEGDGMFIALLERTE